MVLRSSLVGITENYLEEASKLTASGRPRPSRTMPRHVPMRAALPVKHLDLRSLHTVTNFTVVERMNAVPGFKTSAGQ